MLIKRGGVYKNVSQFVFDTDFKDKGYVIVDEPTQDEPLGPETTPEETPAKPKYKRTVKKDA